MRALGQSQLEGALGFRPWKALAINSYLEAHPRWWRQERTGASATTLAQAVGDPIGSWYDVAFGGWWTVPTSDSKRPTVALLNGAYVASFSAASSQTLVGPAGLAALGNNAPGIISCHVMQITDQSAQRIPLFVYGNGGTRFRMRYNASSSGGQPFMAAKRFAADPLTGVVKGSGALTTPHTLAGRFDAANGDGFLYENGAIVASNTSYVTDGNIEAFDGTGAPTLGSEADAGSYWQGYIGDGFLTQTVLPEADQLRIDAHMRGKYRL